MANILAIDTSSEACSVAVSTGEILESFHEISSTKHSGRILEIIEETLSKASITFSDLDLIACGVGPGSFTGIRLSCSVAQGLSFSTGVPLVGVSSLLSMALQTKKTKVACIVNAHMNQVYIGKYEFREGETIGKKELLSSIDNFKLKELGLDDSYFLIGDGCELVGQVSESNIYPDAKAIISVGENTLDREKLLVPEDLKPIYLSGEEHWSKV